MGGARRGGGCQAGTISVYILGSRISYTGNTNNNKQHKQPSDFRKKIPSLQCRRFLWYVPYVMLLFTAIPASTSLPNVALVPGQKSRSSLSWPHILHLQWQSRPFLALPKPRYEIKQPESNPTFEPHLTLGPCRCVCHKANNPILESTPHPV